MHSHRIKADQAPNWPSYTGNSQLVGATPDGRVTVYVDPSLGAPALKNAQDLLADAPRILTFNDAMFAVLGGSAAVIVFALGGQTDGTGGADHMACDYVNGQNIEVDASFGNSMRCSALFEAELSECSMNGNVCGLSTGEALSRWCAMQVSSNALADFATAPFWQQRGMPNWVDRTAQTDQNFEATGCGMAFISWLISLGHPLPMIAQEMVVLGNPGTFADLYAALTGQWSSVAWTNFIAAVRALGSITSDDPFGGTVQPPPPQPNDPAKHVLAKAIRLLLEKEVPDPSVSLVQLKAGIAVLVQ